LEEETLALAHEKVTKENHSRRDLLRDTLRGVRPLRVSKMDDWMIGFLISDYGIHEATQFEPRLHEVGGAAAGMDLFEMAYRLVAVVADFN
jgi:hypothetical protein